jgi:O-antigen/teichoic acid export membrane protein
MAFASQRFFSIEIGHNDFDQLKRLFSLTIIIYILLAILIFILAEILGLWFVQNKLIIPVERKNIALSIYQFSVISFSFTILSSPYMAAIIAHEDMNIYAYVSIVEAILRLGIVFILRSIPVDKLWLYGILTCIITCIKTIIYITVCTARYQEVRFRFYWNKNLFKEIISFTGWSLFASLVGIFKNQFMNILLNQFFNPVVITARSIASSVDAATISLSSNFTAALRPQITKNYATGQNTQMLGLMFYGAKGAYFLTYIFMLPLVIETPFVLSLWLKNIPEYAILFTRLGLIDALIASISYPIIDGAMATGKVKLFQLFSGGILLLTFPVAWLLLLLNAEAYSTMIVAICMTSIAFIARILILRKLIEYSIIQFIKDVVIPVGLVTVLSAVFPLLIFIFLKSNILRLFLTTIISVISIFSLVYVIGINKTERQKIKLILTNYFNRLRRVP